MSPIRRWAYKLYYTNVTATYKPGAIKFFRNIGTETMGCLVTNFFPFYYFSFLIHFVVSTLSCPLWVYWIFYISFYYHRHRACRILYYVLCATNTPFRYSSRLLLIFFGSRAKTHFRTHATFRAKVFLPRGTLTPRSDPKKTFYPSKLWLDNVELFSNFLFLLHCVESCNVKFRSITIQHIQENQIGNNFFI